MTPTLSSYMHAAGILTTKDALWIYGDNGYPTPNPDALFKDGDPAF